MEISFANADVEWEGRIVSAHHKLASTERLMESGIGEAEQWKRYDGEFHQALISNCGSRVLMEAHALVFDKYFRYLMVAFMYRHEEPAAEPAPESEEAAGLLSASAFEEEGQAAAPVEPFSDDLAALFKELEAENVTFRGWATPGATAHCAALDLARTACRRAERRICALQEQAELRNPEIIVYLNRLSDLLWLFARWAEPQAPGAETHLV